MKKLFLFVLSLIIISCGKKDSVDLNALNEDDLTAKINEFYQNKDFTKTIESINIFVTRFPQSPKAAENLKNLALIYTNDLKDMNSAITQYKRIIKDFPQSKECPNAYFTLGFIYNNELKDLSNAKFYYEEFIKLYPDHEAAQSAKFELENLGKNTDEIINKLQMNETGKTKK
jgi:outer membrane protein assembly factor BamD (BamD/ComL family)